MTHVPASSRGALFNGGVVTTDLEVRSPGHFFVETAAQDSFFRVTESLGTNIQTTLGSLALSVDPDGFIELIPQSNAVTFEGPNAAPTDASIVAGAWAFWLDKTNGAAKLMIKAKQADGTVKTAAIALA